MHTRTQTIATTRKLIEVTTRLVRESNRRISASSQRLPASALVGPLPEWVEKQQRLRLLADYCARAQQRDHDDLRQRIQAALSLRSLATEACLLAQETRQSSHRTREACIRARRVALAQLDRAERLCGEAVALSRRDHALPRV